MHDKRIFDALLLELHAVIADAANEAMEKVGRGDPYYGASRPGTTHVDLDTAMDESLEESLASLVDYPPTDCSPALSRAEHESIAKLALPTTTREALEKLVKDAIASAFFRFFCLVDGVADPSFTTIECWLGARIAAPLDQDREMLHDEFYASYWRYLEVRRRNAE